MDFFVRFEICLNTAKYRKDDAHVITRIESVVNATIIDLIYKNPEGKILQGFEAWKMTIVNIDKLW